MTTPNPRKLWCRPVNVYRRMICESRIILDSSTCEKYVPIISDPRLSDPSKWNSNHINKWISWCDRTFAIRLGPIAAILPSTGKELLRLTLQDWRNIGGTGGNILARHLAHLRLQATGVHTPDLLQENENSEGIGKFKIVNSKSHFFPTRDIIPLSKSNRNSNLDI